MGVAAPPQVTEAFAISGTKNTIPVPSQIGITPGAASFTDGFPPLTATPLGSGGIPPSVGDMNGILNMLGAHIAYLQSGAGYQFSSTIATAISGYNIGAVLLAADNSGYWMNLVANNSTNPDTGGANWVPVSQYGLGTVTGLAGSNVTLSATQYGKQILVLSGALTTNINLIFPALAYQWIIVNNTTGSFTITAKTSGGTGVAVAQGGWATASAIQGDGTNIYSQAGNFVTNASLAATLASYVTSTSLATTLSGYVTNASLATQLASYVTSGALTTALAPYLLSSTAASTYVSNSALATALSSYLLSSTAASTYVSNSLLATTLSAYITSTTLTTTLANYATKAYANGTFTNTATTWQQNLPSGQFMQSGAFPNGGSSPVSLTFPTAFPTQCTNVVATPANTTAGTSLDVFWSRTGAIFYTNQNCTISWAAFGY